MGTDFGGQRMPVASEILYHEVNAFRRLFDQIKPALQKPFKGNAGFEKAMREATVADFKEALSEFFFTFEMAEHRWIGEAGHVSDVPNRHPVDPTAGKKIKSSS